MTLYVTAVFKLFSFICSDENRRAFFDDFGPRKDVEVVDVCEFRERTFFLLFSISNYKLMQIQKMIYKVVV